MKRKTLKMKLAALAAATVLAVGMLAGCGGSGNPSDAGGNENTDNENAGGNGDASQAGGGENTGDQGSSETKGGKILYMSHNNSGGQYDFFVAFYTFACQELGYDFQVIYADSQNDPQGNLNAVKNAYTSDVVGLIACQDGGIVNIMEEFPDLYVATLNSDMDSIFNEDGASHAALEMDHFLGTMGDNYLSGVDSGRAFAEQVIEKGYKKVATMIFPPFAYPKHTVADATFRQVIAEYNETADEPIEIVGDEPTVLMFSPLEASFFMEPQNSDLDAIVGMCSGVTFIYPTIATAKADGTCPADLQLVTSGFENDETMFEDCGDGKTISSIMIGTPESALYPLVMLDNAIQGTQFADWTGPERLDTGVLTMDSDADFAAIHDNSPLWDADLSKMAISWDDMKQCFLRWNPNATYADLVKLTQSVSIDSYLQ